MKRCPPQWYRAAFAALLITLAAFSVFANTCTAAVPAGGSCTVTVHFAPNDNQNGYVSTLHVVGKPGGDAQATLSGNGS